MKYLLVLCLAAPAYAQVLIDKKPDEVQPIKNFKTSNYGNMMICSQALDKFSTGTGKISKCGFTLDGQIIGESGLFIYTAPNKLYFIGSKEDGKFAVEIPSGATEGKNQKVFFEIKNKNVTYLNCGETSDANPEGYVDHEATVSTVRDSGPLYKMLLTRRIRSVKSTYEIHLKQVADQNEVRKAQKQPLLKLPVNPYRDALDACKDIEGFTIPVMEELALLPPKEEPPPVVTTLTKPLVKTPPKTIKTPPAGAGATGKK